MAVTTTLEGRAGPAWLFRDPFPLFPWECELPALWGLQEGWLLCPDTGQEAGRACTHGEQAEEENQNGFQ